MSRIAMINPPFVPRFIRSARWQARGRGRTLYYPIWLSYATALLELDHKVRLIDAPATNQNPKAILEDLKTFKPDLIVVDSGFPSLRNDVDFGMTCKRSFPEAKLAMVGPPVAQFSEFIMKSGVDFAALHEYEQTLKDLIETISAGETYDKVNGIYFRKNGEIRFSKPREYPEEFLNRIPFVSSVYSRHLDIRNYALGHTRYPMVQLFTSRGCPFNCSFCSWPANFTGRKVRYRSISNVIEEFRFVEEEMPSVKEIFIEDDTFTLSKKRIAELCHSIKEEDITINWSCNSRADLCIDTMRIMKSAGCRLLDVGFESGNQNVLSLARKGLAPDQMMTFGRNVRESNLLLLADFVIGLEGESEESIRQTQRFIRKLKPHLLQVSIATPIPGTLFHERMRLLGYMVETEAESTLDQGGYQKAVISLPNLSARDLEAKVDETLRKYYLSPAYLARVSEMVIRKGGPDEIPTILKSAIEFIRYAGRRR